LDYETLDRAKIARRLHQVLDDPLGQLNLPATTEISARSLVEEEEEEMTLLGASADVYNVPLTSARKFGSVIIWVKSLLRKLLRPSLEQQVIYNTENHRLLKSLRQTQQIAKQEREQIKQDLLADIANRFNEAIELIEVQKKEIAALKAEVERLKSKNNDLSSSPLNKGG
jgi:polyhydroxyalkanoate synthesis regulator phasin